MLSGATKLEVVSVEQEVGEKQRRTPTYDTTHCCVRAIVIHTYRMNNPSWWGGSPEDNLKIVWKCAADYEVHPLARRSEPIRPEATPLRRASILQIVES